MANSLQTIVNNFVNSQMDKADEDIRASISSTNKKLVSELKRMYRSFIEQFYQYQTSSYVRHGTSRPGTQQGYSLYRAAEIRSAAGRLPRLVVNIFGDRMDESYEYDDADAVFDLIANGIRFSAGGIIAGKYHPQNKGKPWEHTMTWANPSYKGKYFSYHSSIQDAFDAFDNDFDDIAMRMVRDELNERGWR